MYDEKKGVKKVMINNEVVEFNVFDIKNMIVRPNGEFRNPRIAIIAKSGSGKSWVLRDILHSIYEINNIPTGMVIAPTDKMTKFFNDFIPKSFIYHDYKDHLFDKLFARQSVIINKNKKRLKQGKKQVDPRALLVMDDCMSFSKKFTKHEKFRSLMFEGRHYGITFIMTLQYCIGIEPELRGQFDYVVLLREDKYKDKKKLYEHYAGMFPNFRLFESIFDQLTDDFGCMVIDNSNSKSKIKDKIFWYKAKEVKDFKVGNKKYWDFHKKAYDKKHGNSNIKDLQNMINNRKIRI